VLASALLIGGCKKTPTVDVGAVNALVPAKYKYRLEFAPRDVTSGLHRHVTYTVPVPKGWKSDDIGGAEPVDKAVNGESSIWLHSSCDEAHCSPGDWNAAIDQELELLDVVRDERDRVLADHHSEPGQLLVPDDELRLSRRHVDPVQHLLRQLSLHRILVVTNPPPTGSTRNREQTTRRV
jgi:hypothetical protein